MGRKAKGGGAAAVGGHGKKSDERVAVGFSSCMEGEGVPALIAGDGEMLGRVDLNGGEANREVNGDIEEDVCVGINPLVHEILGGGAATQLDVQAAVGVLEGDQMEVMEMGGQREAESGPMEAAAVLGGAGKEALHKGRSLMLGVHGEEEARFKDLQAAGGNAGEMLAVAVEEEALRMRGGGITKALPVLGAFGEVDAGGNRGAGGCLAIRGGPVSGGELARSGGGSASSGRMVTGGELARGGGKGDDDAGLVGSGDLSGGPAK